MLLYFSSLGWYCLWLILLGSGKCLWDKYIASLLNIKIGNISYWIWNSNHLHQILPATIQIYTQVCEFIIPRALGSHFIDVSKLDVQKCILSPPSLCVAFGKTFPFFYVAADCCGEKKKFCLLSAVQKWATHWEQLWYILLRVSTIFTFSFLAKSSYLLPTVRSETWQHGYSIFF